MQETENTNVNSEVQIDVPCPNWLGKLMLKNLRKGAVNGKASVDRARKAARILTSLKPKGV